MVSARTSIIRVMKKLLFPYLFLILFSCTEAESVGLQNGQEYVDVTVSVAVEDRVSVGVDTKSSGTSPVNEDEIKNLLVLQYDGNTDDAKFIGTRFYEEDFKSGVLSLVATPEGTPTTVVFIANTFDVNFSGFDTLGEIKSRLKECRGKDEALIVDENGNQHVIFSAFTEITTGLQPGSGIEVELKRNVAKVEFEIENSLPENITITSVQLCSVPEVSYYLLDPQEDSFPSEKVAFRNMEGETWTEGKTFLYYLPVNIRGKVDNASEQSKNRLAPFNSTYLKVIGTYKKGETTYPVCYKFYLGKNMYDDFNLEPNHHYRYTFDIASIDYSEEDSRVEQWEMVDFSDASYESSNCYILNPASDLTRLFRIPIQQLKTFWGSDRRAIYENDSYFALRGNAEWKAWVIASDFKLTDKFEITFGEGTSDGQPYFEVKVKPDTRGNVIVAVGPKAENDNNDKISWSWHLWITDYNPYVCMDFGNGLDGTYIYPVENGDVHRYEGVYWTYNKSHYIMDRNIGAYSADYPEDDKTGILYYQFGRKDPFFYYTKKSNKYAVGTIGFVTYDDANEEHNAQIYSIHNPLNYVKGYFEAGGNAHNNGPWVSGNKYNPDQYDSSLAWHDPQTVRGGSREGEKSIFDPCPPGFKVPDVSIWSDFRTNNLDNATTNAFHSIPMTMKLGFESTIDAKGLQYWPYQSVATSIPDKVIFYPVTGLILSTYESVQQYFGLNPSSAYAWAAYASPTSAFEATGLSSQARNDDKSHNFYQPLKTAQSRALPVRCITDK